MVVSAVETYEYIAYWRVSRRSTINGLTLHIKVLTYMSYKKYLVRFSLIGNEVTKIK